MSTFLAFALGVLAVLLPCAAVMVASLRNAPTLREDEETPS